MHDLSIDLETLGTRPNAPIVAIGAVIFDRETGEIGDEFYAPIKLSSALLHGTVCPHSLKWWFTQSEKAQAVFTSPEAMELRDALLELSMLIVRHSETIRPWGNGSTFDISILEHAYDIVGLEAPWLFWNVRDMRTIVDAAGAIGLDRESIPFAGTEHNALDDARHQARVIAACWKELAVSPPTVMSSTSLNSALVLKYCELTNRDPMGTQAVSSSEGWIESTFYQVAERELQAMFAAHAALAVKSKT